MLLRAALTQDLVLENHILQVVQQYSVHEQGDLQKILHERGIDVPQATLSRKLKKLNIAKVGGVYRLISASQISLPTVLQIKASEFGLIVLLTHPGQANSLAYYIDNKYVNYQASESKPSDILGTIAGDDTLLLIVRNKEAQQSVLNLLKNEFPYVQ